MESQTPEKIPPLYGKLLRKLRFTNEGDNTQYIYDDINHLYSYLQSSAYRVEESTRIISEAEQFPVETFYTPFLNPGEEHIWVTYSSDNLHAPAGRTKVHIFRNERNYLLIFVFTSWTGIYKQLSHKHVKAMVRDGDLDKYYNIEKVSKYTAPVAFKEYWNNRLGDLGIPWIET